MSLTLVLLRHGESEWNAKNLFTGWVDVGLTDKGRAEAVRGGELPTTALDEEHLDQQLGVVLTASDDAFNELLALGFLGSMKKEWAWRVSRGESTRNLDAFRHLLEDTSSG